MSKWLMVLAVLATCFFVQNVNADEYLAMYNEPPDAKFEVVGKITSLQIFDDVEAEVIRKVGRDLQRKAGELGANALILGPAEKKPVVVTREDNPNMTPPRTNYYLRMGLQIEATAIKMEKSK